MHTINLVKSINLKFDLNSGNNIQSFVDSTYDIQLNPRHRVVSRNKFLKNLKASAKINSLSEITLPDFDITDSETQKLYKVLDIEWNNPRKELALYIKENEELFPIGQVSLLNPSGYPYRMYNLMDLLTDNLMYELGESGELAIGLNDVGYGYLEGNDHVTIYGSYVEEIVIDEELQPINEIFEEEITIISGSTLLLPANQNRKYAFIQNNNSNDVYISLSAYANSRGILIKSGGHYEISTNLVPYYGAISGYCDYSNNVLVVEGS